MIGSKEKIHEKKSDLAERWVRIEPHLPKDVRGVERADDRRVISGIVHVLKSSCHARCMRGSSKMKIRGQSRKAPIQL